MVKHVMKGLAIISAIAIVLVVLFVSSLRVSLDSSDESKTCHTFKKYSNGIDCFRGINPIDSVNIPIESNGNYIGNPSAISIAKWIAASVIDDDVFSITGYEKSIAN